MKAKITKRSVDSAKPGSRDVFLWDTEIRGFGCKVTPKGARVFILQYWSKGRTRRVTLGRFGSDLTVDQARTKARSLRGEIADGGDPAGVRALARTVPLLADFAAHYLADHAKVKKKPRSYEVDECNLRLHILPALGRLSVDGITRADVARFHTGMHAKPIAGNRCLALLSKMFNMAEAEGLRPDGSNPTRHVKKYRENKIKRFLSNAELGRLGAVLEAAPKDGEHPSVIAAIRLLIFTGCRRNEIMTLRWDYVDFEHGCLCLPESKTGEKRVPLGAPALDLLTNLPKAAGNPYVLPGARRGKRRTGQENPRRVSRTEPKHFVGLEQAWRRLRAKAGLDDVRLHDLRHSFASVGAGMGESLPVIGALLGHSNPAMTARYAHLSNDPARAAADRIGANIAAAMKGSPGKVVPLHPGLERGTA